MLIDQEDISKKSPLVTLLLLLTLGGAGIHRIYVGKYISGIFIFLVQCSFIFTKYIGVKWSIVLESVCIVMLVYDLFGIYSNSFTDGKGKIVTDEGKEMVYESEKDRIMYLENRKLNRILIVLGAIAFYIILWILNTFVV